MIEINNNNIEHIFKKYKLISVKNFYKVNFLKRIFFNRYLNKEYKANFCLSKGYNYQVIGNCKEKYNMILKYHDCLHKIFGEYTIDNKSNLSFCCYKSNKNDYYSVWHKHVHTGTLSGVYYYQMPKKEGILFRLDKKIYRYIPEENELIIFPTYITHKPEQVTSFRNRYSINFDLFLKEDLKTLYGKIDKNLYDFS